MLALEGAEGVGWGAGDGLDATGGRTAEEEKSNSRVNSNYYTCMYNTCIRQCEEGDHVPGDGF